MVGVTEWGLDVVFFTQKTTYEMPISDGSADVCSSDLGPEQGISLPGMILVCTDSHTSTHGALGAIAFGVGQSESVHVLSTQTLWQTRPRTLRVSINGRWQAGASAKDIILAVIARLGAAGAVGHALEFAGRDRQSVVEGKGGVVRGDAGGGRII